MDGNTSSKTLIEGLVDSDRVHKSCYTSDEIFDREIEHIFNKSWIYAGHGKPDQEQGGFHHLPDWPPADDSCSR